MCSYNKINQVWSCENNSTLMRDLKIRMKYRGYVMSDWGATHSLSIEKGLDQEMPGNTSFNQQSLKSIPENVIDDSVVRIFTPFFEVGTFDNPNPNQISNNVTSVEHVAIARELSENSTILLKNDGNVLPLKKTNLKVAVVGTQAWNPIVHGGGSGRVIASWVNHHSGRFAICWAWIGLITLPASLQNATKKMVTVSHILMEQKIHLLALLLITT